MTNPTSLVDLANAASFTEAKTGILTVGLSLLGLAALIYGVKIVIGMARGGR